MKGSDFIAMMRQDVSTVEGNNKQNFEAVVEAMAEVVRLKPNCDIDTSVEPHKTPEGCYKYMYDIAVKKKNGNSYFFTPNAALKVVAEYLGLGYSGLSASAPNLATTQAVDLDDLFD